MKTTFAALTGLLTFLLALSAFANDFECTPADWTAEPKMEDGRFKGEVFSDCILRGTPGAGLTALNAHFNDGAKAATEIHSGPEADVWDSLPSLRYDLTNTAMDADNKEISIRAWVDVATNGTDRVVYSSRSQEIKASGNSGFLKRLDISLDVRADNVEAGAFKVRLLNYLEIKRPWYAPSDMFFKKAKEATLDQFLQRREEALPDLWKNL